jgi:hypothetical protein
MKREKVITIRVTEAERDSYHALASLNGKALGEYVRYLLDRESTIAAKCKES